MKAGIVRLYWMKVAFMQNTRHSDAVCVKAGFVAL